MVGVCPESSSRWGNDKILWNPCNMVGDEDHAQRHPFLGVKPWSVHHMVARFHSILLSSISQFIKIEPAVVVCVRQGIEILKPWPWFSLLNYCLLVSPEGYVHLCLWFEAGNHCKDAIVHKSNRHHLPGINGEGDSRRWIFKHIERALAKTSGSGCLINSFNSMR